MSIEELLNFLRTRQYRNSEKNYKFAKQVYNDPAPAESMGKRRTRHLLISVISFVAGSWFTAGVLAYLSGLFG